MQNHKPQTIGLPFVLIILDGWGHSDNIQYNAIAQAHPQTYQNLMRNYPHLLLNASGPDVGLPAGQMGNSEVGHMTMGCGRTINQDLTAINLAIADKSIFSHPQLLSCFAAAKQHHKKIHLLGLLSDGGVHSHQQHFTAILDMAQQQNFSDIYVHAFLDGRDTPPKSAHQFLENISAHPCGKISSIVGRFYAMDRDQRLERTTAAISLLTGNGQYTADDALAGLAAGYARGESDEFIAPTNITGMPTIEAGDFIIFVNFRADRARQLSAGLVHAELGTLITFTKYADNLAAKVLFPKPTIDNILGEVLAANNFRQLRIAETEKYAHVTFFFDGGQEVIFDGEQRILIPSVKVSTYDLQPAMSARQITSELIANLPNFEVIICNFANADMVGHSGKINATIEAIETLDSCLQQIITAVNKLNGQIIITADHGNAELMWDEANNQPHTRHTANLVPCIYIGQQTISVSPHMHPSLKDIAPTILSLLNIPIPTQMTGNVLFV
jgi:2,3-bisphosphoglycerate-independent phosphoglycerate mutase